MLDVMCNGRRIEDECERNTLKIMMYYVRAFDYCKFHVSSDICIQVTRITEQRKTDGVGELYQFNPR